MIPHSVHRRLAALLLVLAGALSAPLHAEDPLPPIAPIPRILPPEGGIELSREVSTQLSERVDGFASRIWEIESKDHAADVAVLVKAVDFALNLGEFYSEKEIPRASELLDLAETRLRSFAKDGERPWLKERGLVVRGYRSRIDASYQPFGLEIPASLDLSKPVPLLVWLHGRGDRSTDLHFLHQCRTKSQAFGGFYKDQNEAIVLYPFGRQCVGWKHAGEVDVFEAIAAVAADYPIDPERIVLAGFSMGGAGAWHIGAHYRDRFCGVHAGAGFAETKEYTRLTPDKYPPVYEQTLWKVYDVPNYVANFLNGPLLAYSGAKDKQKAAADLMARELGKVGHELRHVIAPETEHRYTAESVAEIRRWLAEVWREGRGRPSAKIEWQTPTLRYGSFDWMKLTALDAHWTGARVTADWDRDAKTFSLDLDGVSALTLDPATGWDLAGSRIRIGGETLAVESPGFPVNAVSLVRSEGRWTFGAPPVSGKRPGLQGPIDDAFMEKFVVMGPDRSSRWERVDRWLDFELDHFRSRWRALMRGELPETRSGGLAEEDLRDANWILWGDPDTNSRIAELAPHLPVVWKEDHFVFRGESYPRASHLPVLIFPNPLNPARYVVINSGLTFREGHDRTNSLQNPKLPDWAILGLDRDPDALAPGRIISAGFFDENWK